MRNDDSDSAALRLVNWLTDRAIAGVVPLSSAENLAEEYLIDASFPDHEERIESLINWGRLRRISRPGSLRVSGAFSLCRSRCRWTSQLRPESRVNPALS